MATSEGRYVDGSYLGQNPNWHSSDSKWKAEQIANSWMRWRLSPRNVCDVGCGGGGVLFELQNLMPEQTDMVGYDISPQAIKIAKTEENSRLKFICGDFVSDNNSLFDVIFLLDVFEHIEDYMGFLRRLRQHGKCFIFHIPLDISCRSILLDWPILESRKSVGHIQYFTAATALATLEDLGYRVEDYSYTESGRQGLSGSISGRLRNLSLWLLFRISPSICARLLGGCSLLVMASNSDLVETNSNLEY